MRLAALAAASANVVFWALLGAAPPAQAAQVLSAWQSSSLYGPGVAQMVPRDGRLAGYGFTAVITGVAFTQETGGGGEAVAAAPGDQLVIVSLTEHDDDQSDIYAYNSSPAYNLVSGSHRVPLPSPENLVSPPYSTIWAVSVPTGAPAVLSVSLAGFTQSFDLRSGRRLGTSPEALYRGGNSPEVDVSLSASETLTGTGGPGGPVSLRVAPQEASLVYFKPGATISPPPPPDEGWLLVDMTANSSATDAKGNALSFSGFITAPNVVLKVGKTTVDPLVLNELSNGSPFPDYYGFEVPADITSTTMVVSLNGHAPATDGGNNLTLDFHDQVADIHIALPAPPAARGSGYLPAGKAHKTGPGRSAAGPTHGNAGGGVPVGLVVVLALLVLLGGGVAFLYPRRRRYILAAVPVGRSPAALLGNWRPLPPAAERSATQTLLGLPSPPAVGVAAGAGVAGAAASEEEERAWPGEGRAAEQPDRPLLVILVLGPLKVEGLKAAIRRKGVRRLLVAVALCSNGPVSVERLRDLLADDPDHPESTDGVHFLASRLRAALPEGALPKITAGDEGYQFSPQVHVDWAVFQQLATEATRAEGADKVEVGLRALGLVRGVPVAHGAWEGVAALLRSVETAVENLAADTARAALELRDARSAEAAVNRGLAAAEVSPVLWELRVVAAAAGSGFGVERAWQECRKTLKADASLVEPTYRRLRQGDF